MKVFNFSDELPQFKNAVLTIGTFDGVHIGHQKIISKIKEIAASQNGESVLLTFHPHPRLVLNPDDDSLKLINTLEEKKELLASYGIDNLVIATFSEAFSKTQPEDYVREFLVQKINPRVIVIGYDHQFGKERKGDINLLKQLSPVFNFEVEEIPKQLLEDISISSTKIRKALHNGQILQANDLLGHPFSMEGNVVRGHQIGNKLGYPTANVAIQNKNKLVPPPGVYAAIAEIEGKSYKGMLYIGYRPTFSGTDRSVEINLFDFDRDLYDKKIKLNFIAEIREDIKFDSPEELKEQLAKDKQATLEILK